MRFIFFYFLMLIATCVYAQPDSNYVPYTFPDRVPDSYNLNAKEEYDKIVSQKIRGASAKELALYAEEIVYQHKSLIDNAKIYFNWHEAEDYLNRVLQTLLDDSLKGGDKTHVYLTRIADKNAFTFNDGNIYFNIGLLAEMKDESSIAIILGHELSHYLNSDYLHTFINHLKTAHRKSSRPYLKLLINSSHNNKLQERTADSTGFSLAAAAGYSLTAGLSNFAQFKFEEDWIKSQFSWNSLKWLIYVDPDDNVDVDSLDDLLSSHPQINERISYLKQYMQLHRATDNGAEYIVNKQTFEKLSAQAKIETLEVLLNESDYKECIRKAFLYHLGDRQNSQYLFYLTEGIRRLMYINPSIKKAGFLTDDSNKPIFDGGTGILHDINSLNGDTAITAQLNKELFNDPIKAFESYEQAFQYFTALAAAKKNPETLLSLALYYEWKQQTIAARKCFEEYIGNPGSKHIGYANDMMNKNYGLGANDGGGLVIFNGFAAYSERKHSYYYNFISSQEMNAKYTDDFAKWYHEKFPLKEFISIVEMQKENINGFVELKNLQYALDNFKTSKELEDSRRADGRDSMYWISMQRQKPENPEIMIRNKNILFLYPGIWKLLTRHHVMKFEMFDATTYKSNGLVRFKSFNTSNGKFFVDRASYSGSLSNINLLLREKISELYKKEKEFTPFR